jgi:hypothetical protein
MNIFRFIADMLHLGAILVLLYRIKNTRNCIGKQLLKYIFNMSNTRKPSSHNLAFSASNESGNETSEMICCNRVSFSNHFCT